MASETPRGLLLIGVLKVLKALALLVVGVGLLSMLHRDVAQAVRHWIEFFRLDSHARLIDELLAKVAGISHRTMRRLGVGTLLYATVFGIGGTLLMGIGVIVLGIILMVVMWVVRPEFFRRKPETWLGEGMPIPYADERVE